MNLRFPLLVGLAIIGISIAALAMSGSSNARRIVGVWEKTKTNGKPNIDGPRLEFTRDGKLRIMLKQGDNAATLEGSYKVNGNKLEVIGPNKEETLTIKKLTDNELYLEDSKGTLEEHKRVR